MGEAGEWQRKGESKKEGEESRLCIYSVIFCICILVMFLLWNHFYSNPRLRRPSHGRVAGRDGWREVGEKARGDTLI